MTAQSGTGDFPCERFSLTFVRSRTDKRHTKVNLVPRMRLSWEWRQGDLQLPFRFWYTGTKPTTTRIVQSISVSTCHPAQDRMLRKREASVPTAQCLKKIHRWPSIFCVRQDSGNISTDLLLSMPAWKRSGASSTRGHPSGWRKESARRQASKSSPPATFKVVVTLTTQLSCFDCGWRACF